MHRRCFCSGGRTVSGSTTTTLPQSSGTDPQQLAKNASVGMVSHGFTPAGRAATAIAMHHREQQENGALADAMSLSIHPVFNADKFHQITGAQTDDLSVGGKPVKIYSTWSFTRVAPNRSTITLVDK